MELTLHKQMKSHKCVSDALEVLKNKGLYTLEKEFVIHARSERRYGVYHPFSDWWRCGDERGIGLNGFIEELCKH